MKKCFNQLQRSGMAVVLSAGLISPLLTPQTIWAQNRSGGLISLPELFPIDTPVNGNPNANIDDVDLEQEQEQDQQNRNSGNRGNGKNNKSDKKLGATMRTARVSDEYSCPLFDNKPHAELLNAIDSLTNEVRISQECSDNPSVASLVNNAETLKNTVNSLKGMVSNSTDPDQVDIGDIDQKVTAAIQATQTLGNIINNNSFLNSACGRQTMNSGKALLAFNDILNGLSPYALMAVSMNAALAPALPYVVGGIVVTSGISAMSKMIDQNTLNMTNPDHRTAVLVNTCQFVKVAKKVRFMQLAQSGRIDRITSELEKNVQLYNSKFGKPSKELNQLLSLKSSYDRTLEENSQQLKQDNRDLAELNRQVSGNNDDLMMCMLGTEMISMSHQTGQFPASIYTNLETTARNTNGNKLQVASLKSLNTTSIKKILILSQKVDEDSTAISQCANIVRSWIGGHRQAISLTQSMIDNQRRQIDRQLSESSEYRTWKNQYQKLQIEKQTVSRVEKAMTELAKDNSIIDRSELDQRMSLLKAGLFGRRGSWTLGKSPVQAWLDHTKTMHDRSISGFITGYEVLQNTSLNMAMNQKLTELQEKLKSQKTNYIDQGTIYGIRAEGQKIAKVLGTLNLNNLPLGSRENELVCGQLETAWLDWAAAMDHLGATQFFCDMVDPVLDVKIDKAIVNYCRGSEQVGGISAKNAVSTAKSVLIKKGFQAQAQVVSQRMKELNCPMPPVTVMNE